MCLLSIHVKIKILEDEHRVRYLLLRACVCMHAQPQIQISSSPLLGESGGISLISHNLARVLMERIYESTYPRMKNLDFILMIGFKYLITTK